MRKERWLWGTGLVLLSLRALAPEAPASALPRLRSEPCIERAVQRAQPALSGPAPNAAAQVPPAPAAPEPWWVMLESSSGEPIAGASLILRRSGHAQAEPVELAASSSDPNGRAALPSEPFENLEPDQSAELLVSAQDYTTRRIPEAELADAFGRDEPLRIVLEPNVPFTLAARCPDTWTEPTTLQAGFFCDDGSELQRLSSECEPGEEVVFELKLPRAPLHLVAAVIDGDAPHLALRALDAGRGAPDSVQLRPAPYPIEQRTIALRDGRDTPIAGAFVEARDLPERDVQLERWLNEEIVLSDDEGLFEWLQIRAHNSALAITPPGASAHVAVELQSAQTTLRLYDVSMVRCHFFAADGRPSESHDFGIEVTQREGEALGWFSSSSAGNTQESFAWPAQAASVRVNAHGFETLELRSPRDPCLLRRLR